MRNANGTRTFFLGTKLVDEVERSAHLEIARIAKRERILHQPDVNAQREYGN